MDNIVTDKDFESYVNACNNNISKKEIENILIGRYFHEPQNSQPFKYIFGMVDGKWYLVELGGDLDNVPFLKRPKVMWPANRTRLKTITVVENV